MTIKDFIKYYKILNDQNTDEFSKSIQLVSEYAGLSIDDACNLPVPKFKELFNHIKNRISEESSMDVKSSLPYKFKVDDKEFYVCQTFAEMKFAQFIDWQITLAEIQENGGDIIPFIDKLLACFVWQKTDDGYKYKSFDTLEYIGNADISIAYRVAAFFLKFSKILRNHTKEFLKPVEKKMVEQIKTAMELIRQADN